MIAANKDVTEPRIPSG